MHNSHDRSKGKQTQMRRKYFLARTQFQELKYKDYLFEATEIVNDQIVNYEPTGFFTISAVPQGNGSTERIGREYLLTHLALRGNIKYSPSIAVSVAPIARLLVYVDLQSNGVATNTNAADYLEPPANAQYSHLAFRKLENSERFITLLDKKIVLNSTANIGSTELSDHAVAFYHNINLTTHCLEVLALNSGGTATSLSNINIRVCCICDSREVFLSYQSRLRFRG